jgi:hypothetical protein
VDTAKLDTAEGELTRMIERRSRKGDVDPEEKEELWMESVRRFHARQREQNRWESRCPQGLRGLVTGSAMLPPYYPQGGP